MALYFEIHDRLAVYIKESLSGVTSEEQQHWTYILDLALKPKSSRPSINFLEDSLRIIKVLSVRRFKTKINQWIDYAHDLKVNPTSEEKYYMSTTSIDLMKSLVWMCAHFHDEKTINNIARLAERSYKKVPGKGPTAQKIGNACFFTLYKSKGTLGLSHLSRLRQKIKHNTAQKTIQKYLTSSAEERGITINEIEDIAINDFGLMNGQTSFALGDYDVSIKIAGVGKTILLWNIDGKTVKTIPKVVKDKFAVKIKKLKEYKKLLEKTLTAQRDRLDRMYRYNRVLPYAYFSEYFADHGLMSNLVRDLIWEFGHHDQSVSGFYDGHTWSDINGAEIEVNDDTKVSLWHPVHHSIDDISAWRNFIIDREIKQPLKQAFREIYILTDAELTTKSYSNRMAAHILKQFQFGMLARHREWKFKLLNAYDYWNTEEFAQIDFDAYDITAEYWITSIEMDGGTNDNGLYNYISTDQVRFSKQSTYEVMDLIDVPPIIFSETMRDVDLFVGVASVGNDPTWNSGNREDGHDEYWQSYSFGDLTELAKNRKQILERLLPRLKIAKISRIEGRFLIVQGKLRTYKLHIGSTNILMEPNDQYLCIVPDRKQKLATNQVFLPFEGDTGLSILLSKAFLLADDDKIEDSTIVSQIQI